MPRPMSLQNDVEFIASSDDALAAPAANASKKTIDAWTHKLGIARDTGDYLPVLSTGKTPKRFVIRPFKQLQLRRISDAIDKGMGVHEWMALVFRAAVVDVIGSGVEIVRTNDAKYGDLATEDALDELAAAGIAEAAVNETALFAWARARAISPKP